MLNERQKNNFWKKVNKDTGTDCWEWTGPIQKHGNGCFSTNGITKTPQRVSYELVNGELELGRKVYVVQTCGNKRCVNPDHLNLIDASEKGKMSSPIGQDNFHAKLTDDDVREIRKLIESGRSQREIADMYGMTQPMISYIKNGKKWAHVK